MAVIHTVITLDDTTIVTQHETDITDAQLTLLLNYFAAAQGYYATLADGTDNPESKGDFLLRYMREFISNVVTGYAANAAAATARATVIANKIPL